MLDRVKKPSLFDEGATRKDSSLKEIRFLCGSGGLGGGKVLQSAVDEAMTLSAVSWSLGIGLRIRCTTQETHGDYCRTSPFAGQARSMFKSSALLHHSELALGSL